jgi:hypothetical protein
MSFKDYYEVLGVDRGANQEEIKKPSADWLYAIILTVTRKIRSNQRNGLRR